MEAEFLWLMAGSIMEPVWVIALKRYNDTRSLFWGAVAVLFMIGSPFCLSMAMRTMPVSVSYAIWTGCGAVFAMIAGVVLFKEKVDRLKVLFVIMIIIGVVGLQFSTGGV